MNPQIVLYSRIMRLVVLIAFIIFLLLGENTWVHYTFAATCGIIAALTAWQLWDSYTKGG
ncbi:hypothetical protein F7230_00295 [Corynebacterium sp. 320]|uniref:hypothetical protein n=1 Tax=Corynebacterium TaxID=1716 RepID=UPI00125CB262|nr:MULTISPECIES: hypothetical protein [Corynebacterium]KAB1503614.1 hypothetical protein F7230_00295 [Corynebacterium sp. 320]KAB1553285.1 hypothetical protein F7233_06295 [Corynebacterium sp. 321]KAB1553496.1 hypothetical protein F7232_00290 [Corynebacterium sp. 319]KAB3527750.1 hypothetical protein F8354_00295 [Corynebacterium sp. 250]KAB3540760.1 hypothetical protein F8390_06040 [Corynebacterium sp. 366]